MRLWLRIDQVGAWSKEEFKASGAIWLTFAFMAMFNAVVAYVCLYGMEFGREARFLGAFLFATIARAYFRGAAGEAVSQHDDVGRRTRGRATGFGYAPLVATTSKQSPLVVGPAIRLRGIERRAVYRDRNLVCY